MHASGGFLRRLRDLLLTRVDPNPRRDRPLGLEAIDVAGFERQVGRVIAMQTGFDGRHIARTSESLSAGPAANSRPPSRPDLLSDVEHGRRLVAGIAGLHPVALFVRPSLSEASAQADILQDLLSTVQVVPYRVDADRDPAIVLGLPRAGDHPPPVVLYIGGHMLGDFIAITDALRDGSLAARLSGAGIAFDAPALRALQDSLQKA